MKSGELIRDARRRHGISQRRLALRSGASQAWISRLERGEVSPSVDSLDRLLLVMGESVSLGTERVVGDEDDQTWRETHRARPMAERLERAFDAAAFADELRGHGEFPVSERSFSPQEIFAALHRHGVDYVTIGGIAANAHGSRRVTLDVDVVPAPDDPNYERLAAALDELGAHSADLLLNGAPGAPPYEDLRKRALEVEVRGTPVRIASLDDLIAMKRASGRPQDLRDIAERPGRQHEGSMHPAHTYRRLLLGATLAIALVLASAGSASALTFGLNWDGNNSSQEELLDSVEASGATVYHLPLEFNGPGGDWTNNDHLVEEAWERGVTILPTLQTGTRFLLPTDAEWGPWATWVREVVDRYGLNGSFWEGKANPTPITAWEVWNEPNIPSNDPQLTEALCTELASPWNARGANCAQPQSYGVFLAYTAEQIQISSLARSGQTTNVLFGALNTQVGETYEAFLDGAAASGGLSPNVTGVAIHPYAFADGAAGMAADVSGVRASLDALPEGSAKSLWITEIGWPTRGTVPAGETVSGDEAAGLLTEAFEWIKANAEAANIQTADWYNLRDFGGSTWDGHSGLQAEDGSYQPAWYAFQEQTGAASPGEWAADRLARVARAVVSGFWS